MVMAEVEAQAQLVSLSKPSQFINPRAAGSQSCNTSLAHG